MSPCASFRRVQSPRAYEHPTGTPLPSPNCIIGYKNLDTFLALHVTKNVDIRQQFFRGAVTVKGNNLKALPSVQGLLDEARVRLECGVSSEQNGVWEGLTQSLWAGHETSWRFK